MRKYNPKAVILHSGSRLQFGEIKKNPVDELHPLQPKTPYALNKTAAENMYKYYYNVHNIQGILFRIANPYGPRSQMKHNKYSLINWFIRLAMENKTIKIFGSGNQIRDYIYVEDLADAFILASVSSNCFGETFNVGSGKGTKFKDMVKTILSIVGSGKSESVPWPDNYINVETGDYITNTNKFSKATGWKPSVDFHKGIENTYLYYLKNKAHYW
jgi:nucleoside-diphosphate-sugar epimerase